MKRRLARLMSVFILVLPLLAACGSIENQATSNASSTAQRAAVSTQAQLFAQRAAQASAQVGKTAQQTSSVTAKSWWDSLAELPNRVGATQHQSVKSISSWWKSAVQQLGQRSNQLGVNKLPPLKQPQPY